MFLIGRGVPSVIFAVLFTALLLGSLWCLKNWGRRSGYAKSCVFCASLIPFIIAEIVMTQVGSFMISYSLVGFYQVSYVLISCIQLISGLSIMVSGREILLNWFIRCNAWHC